MELNKLTEERLSAPYCNRLSRSGRLSTGWRRATGVNWAGHVGDLALINLLLVSFSSHRRYHKASLSLARHAELAMQTAECLHLGGSGVRV